MQCVGSACVAGQCVGACAPGATQCAGDNALVCDASGARVSTPGASEVCMNGACAECCPGSARPQDGRRVLLKAVGFGSSIFLRAGTEDGEVRFFDTLLKHLRASPFTGVRRYEHTARAAFIEKGVFPLGIHFIAALSTGNVDARPKVRCDASECGEGPALNVSLQTLTMSGPFEWASGEQPPAFDVFAVPGDRYQEFGDAYNLVWLELSDNAAFGATGGVVTRDAQAFVQSKRANCSPPGFFRASPSAASWSAVAATAGDGGRVYYRVRQCLTSASGPDDPFACVVSATPTSPAYVDLDLPPQGCASECRATGGRSERQPWAWLALLPLALGISRRFAAKARAR